MNTDKVNELTLSFARQTLNNYKHSRKPEPSCQQLESENAQLCEKLIAVHEDNRILREENARLKMPMEAAYWIAEFKYDRKPVFHIFSAAEKSHLTEEYMSGYIWSPLYPAPPAFLIAEAEARGRKEALLERDKLFCTAIVAIQYDDGRRWVCDSAKLLGYINTEKRNMANGEG